MPYLRVFAALGAVLATVFASPAHAERRIALVIGNSSYQNTPALSNPVNDAQDLAAALTRVGFNVDFQRNLTKQGMEAAIARFSRSAQGADAALFYYAGHGMQYRGSNYLMPTDAKLEDEFNLNFELTRIEDVLFGLEEASGVKILILDSCRNNPLLDRLTRNTKSASRDLMATRGLAKINPARGMIVAYSTQANQVAVDGAGRNSPFTSALVKYLDEPGLEVGTLFRRVAFDVNRVTEGRQLPEVSVSLLGDFYLNTRDTDVQAWPKVRSSEDAAQLSDFIKQYPKSPLVSDARQRLDTIERQNRARMEREQAERDEKARQQAENDRLNREKAEKAQNENNRLAQEQADREKTKREEFARAEEERARETRDEVARQKEPTDTSSSANSKMAMLPPPSEPAPSQPAPPQTVHLPSILQCSAHSGNPKIRPSFKADLSFSFSGGVLKAKRIATTIPGWETYEGSVSRTGAIQIKSRGGTNNGISTWTSSYSGQVQGETKLTGRVSILSSKKQFNGFRTCSITFQTPLPELRVKLGLLEADLSPESKSPDIKSEPITKKAARPEKPVESQQEKVVSRSPAASAPMGNATHDSFKIIAPGSLPTGETRVFAAPGGRKMTCTGGSITRNIPRTCFWN